MSLCLGELPADLAISIYRTIANQNIPSSAGVTGLTSALFLAEAGYVVTIVAAHVPGDSSIEYTSPW